MHWNNGCGKRSWTGRNEPGKEKRSPRSGQAGKMDERKPIQVQTQQSDGKSHRLQLAQVGRTDCLGASWPDGN
jgi:hypothetical protein